VSRLRAALAVAVPPSAILVDTGKPTRTLVYRSRRPIRAFAAVIAAALVVVGGLVVAALVTTLDDSGRDQPRREVQSGGATSEESTTTEAEPADDGVALNDQGFALMQAGRYDSALPLLRRAVVALNGSGTLSEAFASYNLAFSRFASGQCDGVIGLLDRSERIQGERKEIDQLRKEWERQCAGDEGDGEAGSGRGRGKGKGKGHQD
jgi:hypothetical protein